jgi:hypothetical protein
VKKKSSRWKKKIFSKKKKSNREMPQPSHSDSSGDDLPALLGEAFNKAQRSMATHPRAVAELSALFQTHGKTFEKGATISTHQTHNISQPTNTCA